MSSNRPILFDFIPENATLPQFAEDMLAFFGTELDANDFWTAFESYYGDSVTVDAFFNVLYYTFADSDNLLNMMNNMLTYSVTEAQAPDMPEAYWRLFQIFDDLGQAATFIDKINYYGQDSDDVLRMPDVYCNVVGAVVNPNPDIYVMPDERYFANGGNFVFPPIETMAFQTPV